MLKKEGERERGRGRGRGRGRRREREGDMHTHVWVQRTQLIALILYYIDGGEHGEEG